MGTIDNKIKEKLDEHGLSMKDLSPEELGELKKEIEAEEKGMVILDGVLSHKDKYSE